MNTVVVSTRFDDGKVVATSRIDGKRRQATVKGAHTGDTHAEACYRICKAADIRTRVRSNLSVKEVIGGFDFKITYADREDYDK